MRKDLYLLISCSVYLHVNSCFVFGLLWWQDVHETAAGALWNLAFNPGNALRMVEEEGVPALVHLCSSSRSKMARFMAALALAYMFDGRWVAASGLITWGLFRGPWYKSCCAPYYNIWHLELKSDQSFWICSWEKLFWFVNYCMVMLGLHACLQLYP